MPSSLDLLFEAINQARSEADLRSQIVPKVGEYFAAKRQGIFFFDQLRLTDAKFQKVLKLALSIDHNPIARYLVERHAPIHEALVTSPRTWRLICPRPDHWHVMAGPLINQGQLVGVVACTRAQSMPAFDAENLIDLSALCLHLSVWVAAAYAPRLQAPPLHSDRLTSRELEIAALVALGKTNAEIGTELWITENSVKQALKRMFRKLGVGSRAEMVAHLATVRRNSP